MSSVLLSDEEKIMKKYTLTNHFDAYTLDMITIHKKLKSKQYNKETIDYIANFKKEIIELCDHNISILNKLIKKNKIKDDLIFQIYKKRGLDSNSPEVKECNNLKQLRNMLNT